MTGRYLRRLQLRETWRITRGFALKQAATDADLARELFFDGALPADTLARYVAHFAADSTCGLDLADFLRRESTRSYFLLPTHDSVYAA